MHPHTELRNVKKAVDTLSTHADCTRTKAWYIRSKCEPKGGGKKVFLFETDGAQCVLTAAAAAAAVHATHAYGSHYIPLQMFQRVHFSSVGLLP